MKHRLCSLAVVSTLAMSGSALANGWKTLPFQDADWKPNFTLAASVGPMNIKEIGTAIYQGSELSLDCPWFQPPTGLLRQQFNYGYYSNGNVKLKNFELNPHYYVTVAEGWMIGAGPGVGYIFGVVGHYEVKLPSIQFSAGVNYRKGHYFAGLGARVQNARNDDIAPGITGVDNTLVNVKLGYNF